jgi:hypothetical protein
MRIYFRQIRIGRGLAGENILSSEHFHRTRAAQRVGENKNGARTSFERRCTFKLML